MRPNTRPSAALNSCILWKRGWKDPEFGRSFIITNICVSTSESDLWLFNDCDGIVACVTLPWLPGKRERERERAVRSNNQNCFWICNKWKECKSNLKRLVIAVISDICEPRITQKTEILTLPSSRSFQNVLFLNLTCLSSKCDKDLSGNDSSSYTVDWDLLVVPNQGATGWQKKN